MIAYWRLRYEEDLNEFLALFLVDSKLSDFELRNFLSGIKKDNIDIRKGIMKLVASSLSQSRPFSGESLNTIIDVKMQTEWVELSRNNYTSQLPIRFHHGLVKWFRPLEMFYYFGNFRDELREAFLTAINDMIDTNLPQYYDHLYRDEIIFTRDTFKELKSDAEKMWDEKEKSPVQIVKAITLKIREVSFISIQNINQIAFMIFKLIIIFMNIISSADSYF